ncbi:MAG TPA: hypothetical protein VHO01_15640 [Jatrophihabitans sp.]|nr:hypothetical protein [Jatrophihabitans sp.]
MEFAIGLIVVAAVLCAIGLLNRRSHAGSAQPRPRTAQERAAALARRRAQEARDALARMHTPENTVARGGSARPLGLEYGDPTADGVLIIFVWPGSPAARLGMTEGAVLTSIGGRPTPDADAAAAALGHQIVGLGVRLTWTKNGQVHDASVIL